MFRIEMLLAQRGDALWLSYGEQDALHHVLADAGPRETIGTLVPELERRIAALPGRTNRIELLATTHIDADHIQGIVSLLSGPQRLPLFRDVWFNGFKHLRRPTRSVRPRARADGAARDRAEAVEQVVQGRPGRRAAAGLRRSSWRAASSSSCSTTPAALARLVPKWGASARGRAAPARGMEVPRSDATRRSPRLRHRPAQAAPSAAIVPRPAGAASRSSRGTAARASSARPTRTLEAPAAYRPARPHPHDVNAVKLSHHGSRANVTRASSASARATG